MSKGTKLLGRSSIASQELLKAESLRELKTSRSVVSLPSPRPPGSTYTRSTRSRSPTSSHLLPGGGLIFSKLQILQQACTPNVSHRGITGTPNRGVEFHLPVFSPSGIVEDSTSNRSGRNYPGVLKVNLVYYQAKNGQWTWQMRAKNHRVIANAAETYSSKNEALRAAVRIADACGGLQIFEQSASGERTLKRKGMSTARVIPFVQPEPAR